MSDPTRYTPEIDEDGIGKYASMVPDTTGLYVEYGDFELLQEELTKAQADYHDFVLWHVGIKKSQDRRLAKIKEQAAEIERMRSVCETSVELRHGATSYEPAITKKLSEAWEQACEDYEAGEKP